MAHDHERHLLNVGGQQRLTVEPINQPFYVTISGEKRPERVFFSFGEMKGMIKISYERELGLCIQMHRTVYRLSRSGFMVFKLDQ